ncbi:MAG: M48 family metalloprotease [bacterium]|nr:M48 family metalloprotease [bacterium]
MNIISALSILTILLIAGCAELEPSNDPYDDVYSQAPYGETSDDKQVFTGDPRKELGRQFLLAAANEFKFVNDPDVVSLVNHVGRSLVLAANSNPDYYHFFIVRKNQLNAFAVPGGYIFIYDGLLKNMKSVDELAGVLAHEIAHVERDHYLKDSKKTTLADFATLAGIIAGISSGNPDASIAITSGANLSYKLKLSREHETEADVSALKYLSRTDYKPAGLASFFKTLSLYERLNSGDAMPPYLSTHPGITDRQGILESMTRNIPDKPAHETEGRWDWDRIINILRAADKDGALIKGSDENAKKHYLKGLYAFKSYDLKTALAEYKEAIRINPDNHIYHADLAMLYMQMQHYDYAKEEALISAGLSEENPAPFIVLGMAAKNAMDYKEAVKYFSKAADINQYDPFIRYHLAGSSYAQKMTTKGRYELGHFYRLSLSPERALMQFRMALKETNNPDLAIKIKEEIDRLMREGI